MDVDRKRPAEWPHWPERGNGAPRRDRLELRLFRDSEREVELARVQETIRQIERAAAEKAEEIERLERAVANIDGVEPEVVEERTPEPEPEVGAYLVFVWTPSGYALRDGEGQTPAAGNRLRIDSVDHVVARIGCSPLPGDGRRCAYLEPF